MKATLSYKSKRNIIIASVIVVLLAAISTAGYFYIKGNDETARAFTQNEITNELTPGGQTQNNGGQQENQPQNPEQPATPGEQNNNGGEQTPNSQTNNGQNQNNNQNRPNNNTTNNGSTPNQTTGNVPNQEYVTERTEERTTITKEYSVEWTPESITANASVQNLNIIRPIISANKSADKNAVVPGETITYTITVTNTGNADGKAIVKDTIPEATEFIENSIKVNGEDTNYTAQNLEEGITVDVAKQNEQGEAGTVKVEFKVKVSNIFAQYEKASIINQATVNEEKTNEVKNPVIKFEKSANKEKVEVGDTVTYTISIENIGDAEGTVIVKDTIPTGTKLVENSTIKLNGEDTNYTEQILNDGIELKVKSGERLEITFEVEVLSEITEAVKNTAYVNDIPTETIPTQVESLIKFESNGGTSVESMNGYTGDVIENREMPTTTREGYTFDGWYAEPELTNKVETLPEKYPAGTTTYYAKWTKNSYKITYKIVGDYFTNNNYKEETLEYGAQITPEANPTQEGYTFSGWSEIPETMPAHDVEVVGSYTKNSYKITYKIVGDYFTNNNYKEETLEYGAQITPEANPTQEGYTFSGWSEIPETMPAHDVEVVGSYTKNSYKITYKIVGDYFANNNYKEETLEYGAQITPEANPTQEGYTFSGWLEIPETMPAHDVEVVGSYTKNSYKITYKIVGDYFTNNNYKEETLEYGAQITPEVNPTQEGYTFSGWSEIPETMPAHDVEVVGSYTKNSYKITYKIVGDYFANNNYKEETLEYGAQITPEVNPTQEGYTFSGWLEIPETMPAHDVEVVGSYTKNSYKITYKIVGDYFANNNYKEETLEYGAQITPEANPTQEGYTFSGWLEIPETMPAHDVEVVGSYTKNSYKIIYKIVGDYFTNNNYKEETLEYGAQITPEVNPTQEGYTFSGWSEIPETMPAHDVEVVGSYTKNSYKIIYKIVGDYFTNNNYKEETLEYGAQITPEVNPTQEGYTFSGWSEIPETMPAHDVEVVGSYTKNSYKITYKIVGDYFTNNNYKEETLEYGAQITPEVNPTQEGYTFSGWSEIPETMPAHDVEVVGSYTKNSYKITYKIVGDYFTNNNYKEETLEYGAQITPEVNPTQEGYTFSGWSEIPETMPAHDVEVVGSYTKNSYKITYKIVGDYFTNNNYKEETLEYGAQITPEANPTQEGYTFSGWSEIPETMPANDVVVEGSYTRNNYQYKVKYWYENEQGTYEPLETVIGGEVPYGTVIDTFTQKDGDGKYVLDHVDPAKSATDNKTANLVITHKESENILNVYYKRNSFNYKIEYYKEIANGEEFITSTGNKQQKLKTKITDEILKADFGANWKNVNKPQKGYQDGIVKDAEATDYYITIKESNNVIKVVYKLKTNIEYTVKYYFNEVPLKEDSGTAKYGQQINSVNDYSDGVWIKDEQKSTSLPYTIKESGNVIKVYYVKPDIKAKKTIWQDSAKLNDNAIVEAGSTVTYKITASNTGYLAGNVTIKDEELPQGNVTNITATGYTETLTVQDLKDGIVLNVPARGTAEVTITIKLTGAIGTPISNTAKYDNTETNKVENNVEKTVALKAKAEQVQVLNTNVILVMDISFSMNDRPVCTDHTTEKEHRDAGCSKRGDTWLKKDTKIDIAKTVINKFIDSVKLPDQATTDSSIIEVIKFNGWPDVVGEASNSQSKSDLKAKVNRLSATGGTWYSRPLAMTTEEITKLTEERPDNRNIVIFVSDGEPAKQDKKIIDEANKLKAVPNTTVYTVGFDADIEILKQIATDDGKYRTTDQASSLNTIFNEIVDEIAIKTEKKQSVSGKIELSNIDLSKTNKVVIKVNGTAISADKVQAAIVTENSKYYIDLNKLNLSSLRDDVLIEYFIKK